VPVGRTLARVLAGAAGTTPGLQADREPVTIAREFAAVLAGKNVDVILAHDPAAFSVRHVERTSRRLLTVDEVTLGGIGTASPDVVRRRSAELT
jgi:hypothetical protein